MFDKKNVIIDGCECEISIETELKEPYLLMGSIRRKKRYIMLAKVKLNIFEFEVSFYKEKFLEEDLNEEEIKSMFKEIVKKVISKKNENFLQEKESFLWNNLNLESLL